MKSIVQLGTRLGTVAVALSLVAGIAACGDMSPRTRDTAIGAGVGGAAGAAIGGSGLSTLGGAAVGGVIGNQIGK
ncbi:glycine zipper 2TM domain-containing protein [Paraburkholderia sp. BR14320]|uniref:glycine zipper 2TM domain-containing protein n=1 Tax=unclassified Paraburkholderia TaxID=2615204 RepID=UPI0034CDF293